jgi:hypothetical protein
VKDVNQVNFNIFTKPVNLDLLGINTTNISIRSGHLQTKLFHHFQGHYIFLGSEVQHIIQMKVIHSQRMIK